MRLTPLDIHHKEFNHALRGYNEAEVDEFLDDVADELERLFKENIDLSERIEALEQKVREYQDMERTLHNTLLSAQKSADEIVQKAQREAEAVLKDAEVKAKEVIHDALTSKQRAVADLARIKDAEEQFRVTFKAVLERYLGVIEEVELPEDVKPIVQAAESEEEAAEQTRRLAEPAVERRAGRELSVPEKPAGRAIAETQKPVEHEEERSSGVITSLHLGDLGEPDIEPDTTMEFDVAEFGFGEREDDIDIEEID